MAAAVAGRLRTRQAGVGFVLHIADQDAVFNQYGAACFVAFVVDVERTAPAGNIALIDDGNAFGGDAFADPAGKDAGPLAVEIAFQTVSDRFVQQHARPTVAQNDGHLAGRRRTGFEIGQGLFDGGIDKLPHQGFIEISQVVASSAARAALFAAFALFGDDGNVQAHHRADVGGVFAVQTGEVNHIVFAGQTGHHLHDARIGGFGDCFHFVQQRDFGGGIEAGNGVGCGTNRLAARFRRHFGGHLAACRPNRADGAGGTVYRIDAQAVGVGKGGFVARNGAHAHTLIDLEAARFDDALFQMPAFISGALAVDIGIIDVVRADDAQAFGEQFGGKAVGFEQPRLYGGIGRMHSVGA